MLLLHVMSGNASLRQSHAQQPDPALRRFLGIEEWVSYSQSWRAHPPPGRWSASRGCSRLAFAPGPRPGRTALPRAASRRDALGLYVLRFGREGRPLERIRRRDEAASAPLSTVAANDAVALAGWDLSGLEGRTLVFDLGYYSHRNLGRLCAKAGCTSSSPASRGRPANG
jgi:hypothetical protein